MAAVVQRPGDAGAAPVTRRGVEVSNKLDKDGTIVKVVYTQRPGLLADLCACLDAQSLRVIRADVSGTGPLRAYRFWVVNNKSAFKLEHTELTPVSLAVRDSVVQQGLWAKTYGSGDKGPGYSPAADPAAAGSGGG
eukprot:CAMPEP_0197603934 /NCGR_PEP_ID=MMETSP1326-20131121/40198_1 /TAXON_ID=1155430 /ORGANISM="Genus nov. species nov., Strain RCC2288" /LENGTH=135 /DNA_ID=CAMNT_0043171517 /DNA_START=271 /DNA_END=675 /DNA_ORIENTATION=+